jgi:steroid delta-isomerase-like uncharacterized protein
MTTQERNKETVRRFFAACSEGDLDVIDELVSPDFIAHDPALPEPLRGRDAIRTTIRGLRMSFPDLRIVIADQIAEGDSVATRWKAQGTQRGFLLGIPPTQLPLSMTGISIARFRDGVYVESWLERDVLSPLRALRAGAPALQGSASGFNLPEFLRHLWPSPLN